MTIRGYYRHPTIHDETVVFVSEDDLWSVSTTGGTAHRLTANPGSQTFPRFSPDGASIAFVSRDEGRPEVHVMDAGGGPSRRLTYFGSSTDVVGWGTDGDAVIAASDVDQPFPGWKHLWAVRLDGSQPTPVGVGPARAISFAPRRRGADGGAVIGRNSLDPARWKRYRGGRAGSIWIDRDGSGEFVELVSLPGNLADPMWIGRRIYFLSDHEGVGNIYSVTPSGRGLTRHTHHESFYARFPSTDGRRIVYHCAADLWLFDPSDEVSRLIEVTVPSARPQLNRRFVSPARYLESFGLHPQGHSLAVTARGASVTMPLWEGAPMRHGPVSRHRQRLTAWLPDGERVVAVSDEKGEEALVVRSVDGLGEPTWIERDLGRVRSLDPAPAGTSRVALTNQRHEVMLVDLTRRSRRVLYRSPYSWIRGTAWSPDGRWLCFAAATSRTTMNLFLYDTQGRRLHQIGRPDFVDFSPAFDPDGKYLGFLSTRVFDPTPDAVFHDFGFPRATIPMLIPLSAETPSPFRTEHRESRAPGAGATGGGDGAGPPEMTIDLDGLADRAQAVPVPPGRYASLRFGKGRILMHLYPLTGSNTLPWAEAAEPTGILQAWDLTPGKLETVAEGVTGFTLSADGAVLAIRHRRRLRVVAIGWKDEKNGKDQPGRETGWIDLDRIRLEVLPTAEWKQMFAEAWRLQRDHFWTEDMGGLEWLSILDRYLALVDRVGARSEFSDLLWEMQGELGTSHAYELGGDYRPEPAWTQGSLGADLAWDRGAWRVASIPRGDPWDPRATSPLTVPGVGIGVGDRILAVDGVQLEKTQPAEALLVDKGGRQVTLRVASGRRRPRAVVVSPLSNGTLLRYRDWVESNRDRVHAVTDGRAGYIHIPDMLSTGFAEFHRYWRSEVDRDGLVIDVRFNRGGNVSSLLLQKLMRRRVGLRVTRWREPHALPPDAPAGPMVCLTNEMTGSDGDIFSHSFKLNGLGPLIGTRTWGGVVGIWPQQSLVDGTVTTQPEFSTWFHDVGYEVENRGTDPDTEIVITPQDYRQGRDPQLERGIEELMTRVATHRVERPDIEDVPRLSPPKLTS